MTYTQAITELEKILENLEKTEEIDMDKIAIQVKRAAELMKFCKKQLHTLDENLEKLLEELEK